MKTVSRNLLVVFFMSIILGFIGLYAQTESNELVITKVNLDPQNESVWIEVHNPSDLGTMLTSLSISGIRTPNVLPKQIRKKNGFRVESKENIIICSDKDLYQNKNNSTLQVIEQKLLKNLIKGGVVTVNTMGGDETQKNVVIIGNSNNIKIVNNINKNSLAIPDKEITYSRQFEANNIVSKWSQLNK